MVAVGLATSASRRVTWPSSALNHPVEVVVAAEAAGHVSNARRRDTCLETAPMLGTVTRKGVSRCDKTHK